MQKLALVLLFIATLVFAQFFPNWSSANPSPIGGYIVAGIILLIVLVLLIARYTHKNNKHQNDYHFRDHDQREE